MNPKEKINNNQKLEFYFKKYNLLYPFEFTRAKPNPYTKIEVKVGNKKIITSLFKQAVKANDCDALDFFLLNYKPTLVATIGLNNQKSVLIQDILLNQQPEIAKLLLTHQKKAFNNISVQKQQKIEFFDLSGRCRYFACGNYQTLSFFFGFNSFEEFLVKNDLANFEYGVGSGMYGTSNEKNITPTSIKKVALIIGGNCEFIDKYLNKDNIKELVSFNYTDYFSADILLNSLSSKSQSFYHPVVKKHSDQLTLIYALQHIIGENRADFNPNLEATPSPARYFYTGNYPPLKINLLTLSILTRNIPVINKIKNYFGREELNNSCLVAKKLAPFLDLCYQTISKRHNLPLIQFKKEVDAAIDYLRLDEGVSLRPSAPSKNKI